MAGASELIATDADDYVRIASCAIEDIAWRRSLAAMIREGAGALFDSRAPLDAFAALLQTEGY
jgi:hypothetical protein